MRNYLDGLLLNKTFFSLNITSSLPIEMLAFYLANSSRVTGPQMVIIENTDRAKEFVENFEFWSKRPCFMLPHYDPSVFAGVELLPRQLKQRLSWLYHAQNQPLDGVFVTTVHGLLQKTLPSEVFFDHCLQFKKGDSIPEDFFERLYKLGYQASPMVEDTGHFSNRGGLVDIYSPQMTHPVRIELFGSEIESLRYYDPTTQRTIDEISDFTLCPAREVLLNEKNCLEASQKLLPFKSADYEEIISGLRRQEYSQNLEYHLPLFYNNPVSALSYFDTQPTAWIVDELNVETSVQKELSWLESFYKKEAHPLSPKELFLDWRDLKEDLKKTVSIERINIVDSVETLEKKQIEITCRAIQKPTGKKWSEQLEALIENLDRLPHPTLKLISVKGSSQYSRIKNSLETNGYTSVYHESSDIKLSELESSAQDKVLHFIPNKIKNSFHLPSEDLAVISLEHYLGKAQTKSKNKDTQNRASHLSFGELKINDYIIHAIHGICQFKGLETMIVAGVEAEFLVLEFKDKDKLFLPIYRIHQIHKYSNERAAPAPDKLGGSRFTNIKTKTKKRLREMAHDLIKLYAQRTQTHREAYSVDQPEVIDFFNAFPYQETDDQLAAIEDLIHDFQATKPMDRLICGDVGFGKTEVAMRAAFICAQNKKQVAVLAPTTVLTMQHIETFKKRFKDWPMNIQVVNRLQPNPKVKKILEDTKSGAVDILIGTHRLLSQDVNFKNLGLLIVDEEQKFGVKHKEKIRKIKVGVDTISLSATPIPRTLNMSLLKIRDLSLINTAPVDRLEIRTFICRYDKEIIKRAIETELERGGQVFFLHNRVQSIYSVADELRQLLPKTPIGVGHGQLPEKDLESVMISFFNNELKVLVCSAIIESGVDIPNANTILINQADHFGLSQLYQLRGRVGRSGRRAYCYLLTEPNKKLTDISKERLKVIQENTALGSGMQIAQYDLELRGAGTLLGEEQSGLIDNLGYEFYMELLEEAIQEAKGEKLFDSVEPDINLKIKAFIPNSYISNIRIRLSYYRALTQIKSADDIDKLEDELKDQFGKPPEEVVNLLGLMLIRRLCIDLGVKDISSGPESLVLSFTDHTPLTTKTVINLATQSNKKYSITPDNRLKVRMKEITWPRVFEEVTQLLKLC